MQKLLFLFFIFLNFNRLLFSHRRFLSRRCFTLCITMEVEPRIAKLYKWHNSCFCKNYRGKVDGGWIKSVCIVFQVSRTS